MRDDSPEALSIQGRAVELSDLASRARERREPSDRKTGRGGEPIDVRVEEARGAANRLCRDCEYDLTGIDWSPAACPECGREFDPNDMTTTKAEGEIGRVRRIIRQCGPPVAIGLLLLVGFQSTVLPRPADLRDWRLWKWLGGLYGVEKVPGSAYRGWGQPFRGAPRGAVHWWGERPWRVEAHTVQGERRWEIERIDERHWRVETHEPDVMVQELLTSFSAIKPEMFGVQYSNQSAHALETDTRIEGTTAQVFGELIDSSDLRLSPFIFRENQPYVWVFDEAIGEMVTISLEEATERGLDITVDSRRRFDDRPIVPPPGDGSAS